MQIWNWAFRQFLLFRSIVFKHQTCCVLERSSMTFHPRFENKRVKFYSLGTVSEWDCHDNDFFFLPTIFCLYANFRPSHWSPRNWAETQEPRRPASRLHLPACLRVNPSSWTIALRPRTSCPSCFYTKNFRCVSHGIIVHHSGRTCIEKLMSRWNALPL